MSSNERPWRSSSRSRFQRSSASWCSILLFNCSSSRAAWGTAPGQRLAGGANPANLKRVKRALGGGIEGAQGLDLIAKKLDTDGARQGWRKEIDDSAPVTELARLLYLSHRLIAQVIEMFQQQRKVNLLAGLQVVEG